MRRNTAFLLVLLLTFFAVGGRISTQVPIWTILLMVLLVGVPVTTGFLSSIKGELTYQKRVHEAAIRNGIAVELSLWGLRPHYKGKDPLDVPLLWEDDELWIHDGGSNSVRATAQNIGELFDQSSESLRSRAGSHGQISTPEEPGEEREL